MFRVTSGVLQCGHLSPLLFNLFINTVILNTPSCRILLLRMMLNKLLGQLHQAIATFFNRRYIIFYYLVRCCRSNSERGQLLNRALYRSRQFIDYNCRVSVLTSIFDTFSYFHTFRRVFFTKTVRITRAYRRARPVTGDRVYTCPQCTRIPDPVYARAERVRRIANNGPL